MEGNITFWPSWNWQGNITLGKEYSWFLPHVLAPDSLHMSIMYAYFIEALNDVSTYLLIESVIGLC